MVIGAGELCLPKPLTSPAFMSSFYLSYRVFLSLFTALNEKSCTQTPPCIQEIVRMRLKCSDSRSNKYVAVCCIQLVRFGGQSYIVMPRCLYITLAKLVKQMTFLMVQRGSGLVP